MREKERMMEEDKLQASEGKAFSRRQASFRSNVVS